MVYYVLFLMGAFLRYLPQTPGITALQILWAGATGLFIFLLGTALFDADMRKHARELVDNSELSHIKGALMIVIFAATEHWVFTIALAVVHIAMMFIAFDSGEKEE